MEIPVTSSIIPYLNILYPHMGPPTTSGRPVSHHLNLALDTRAQKMVSHTVAHYTMGLAHGQHREEQNTLSSPQMYCHSQEHNKWLFIQ